jgi:hypothetical protein
MTAASTPAQPAGTAGQAAPAQPWRVVTREVAADRISRVVFVAATVAVGFAYSVLLPFDFTQRISLANWQYFGPRYAAFTVGLALGLAWVVTLQVHAMRRIARNAAIAGRPRRGGPGGAVAAVVSLLPSFLCCSPIVPTVVSLIGLPVATQLRTTGTITWFFATQQDWLLAGALAVLAASGLWSTRKLARAGCLAEECCPAGDPTGAAETRTGGQPEPSRGGGPDVRAPAVPAGGHDHGRGQ